MTKVVQMVRLNDGLSGEGQGKAIMTLMAYPMPESPPDSNRAKPMRILHLAFANAVWLLQNFFVDSSRLRRTGEMMENYGGDERVDDRYRERMRDILM